MKKKAYILLIASIGVNLMVLSVDTIPFIYSKIEKRIERNSQHKEAAITADQLEKTIVDRSLHMIRSQKSIAVWQEHGGFTESVYERIYEVIHKELPSGHQRKFENYNYPRAFLCYGLSEYLIKKNNLNGLESFKKYFDEYYITPDGMPAFHLDKVDQVPFGLTAINLYSFYKEEKYKTFYDTVYRYTLSLKNQNNIIPYRTRSDMQLIDVLGMVVPFLIKYAQVASDSTAIDIARFQMDFYIRHGVDDETHIPSHAVNMLSNIKAGSGNWGRGIGWYLLSLSSLNNIVEGYSSEFDNIIGSLNKIRNKEGLWSQFPGSSDYFDASTTTMFLYCMPKEQYTASDILNKLDPYISKDGFILQTSGDTYWINSYSKTFGKSELSQGMLLLILSRY